MVGFFFLATFNSFYALSEGRILETPFPATVNYMSTLSKGQGSQEHLPLIYKRTSLSQSVVGLMRKSIATEHAREQSHVFSTGFHNRW